MDLFEMARVPPNVSIEDAIKTLVELKDEGHFQHIGMSECTAATLRRAHAVHPIATVEIEVSLWSYEEETKRGKYPNEDTLRFECITRLTTKLK